MVNHKLNNILPVFILPTLLPSGYVSKKKKLKMW